MVDDYSKVIKELRSKMTLSQVEFAQLLGVSFASVNRWETGKHEPTIKIKRKIKASLIIVDSQLSRVNLKLELNWKMKKPKVILWAD